MKWVSLTLITLTSLLGGLTYCFPEAESATLPITWLVMSLACLSWALCIARKHRALAWGCTLVGLGQLALLWLLIATTSAKTRARDSNLSLEPTAAAPCVFNSCGRNTSSWLRRCVVLG